MYLQEARKILNTKFNPNKISKTHNSLIRRMYNKHSKDSNYKKNLEKRGANI